MKELILDIVLDSILDCLKLVPFLLITYLFMEWLEHTTTSKTKETISKADKYGPIIGAILGVVPQCGFSVSATNLYVGRVVTLGTLISIYLSTSDEMIPIFLSESVSIQIIYKILLIKVIVGIIAGVTIDFVLRKLNKNSQIENTENISKICEEEHCNCCNNKKGGIFKSALNHTLNISGFILLVNLLLNTVITIIGEDNLGNLLLNQKILGPIIAGAIGLIPNCAASVVIAELYVKKIINVGTMLAGLLVGAGVGLLVLFRMNKNLKENLKITIILYSIGVSIGIIFEIIGITI